MVSVTVPVLVPAVVETVSVEVAVRLGVTGDAIEHVAPEGQPVTTRPTLLLNPFRPVIVAVDVPVVPWVSVSDAGLTEIEKSEGAFTFSATSVA